MQQSNHKKTWKQPELMLISTNDAIQGGGAVHTIHEVSQKSGRSFFVSSGNGLLVVNKITFYNAS